jgi:hypothetical protein
MRIIIETEQGIKHEIDTSKAHSFYSILEAFKQALRLEGYTEEYINRQIHGEELRPEAGED